MRVAVVCFAAMLACSCCRTRANSNSVCSESAETRKRAICASLKESYSLPDVSFEVRGPLTIAAVEHESAEQLGYSPRADIPAVAFGFQNPRWLALKGKYAPGDELYYFTSDERSWRHLLGIEGYVLVRENEIVDTIVTRMN